MRRIAAGAVAVLLALLAPENLPGQQSEHADSVHAHNDCRLAHQVLVHGQPSNKYAWALTVIGDCGSEGADAIAHALGAQRTARTRSAELDDIANVGSMIVDAEVLRAALDLASDETAGEAARVHAIGLIVAQITRSVLPYDALITDPRTGQVIVGDVSTSQPLVVRDLPADARVTALAVLSRLKTQSQNQVIRLAARRAFYRIRADR
jgi:hypothetical protein